MGYRREYYGVNLKDGEFVFNQTNNHGNKKYIKERKQNIKENNITMFKILNKYNPKVEQPLGKPKRTEYAYTGHETKQDEGIIKFGSSEFNGGKGFFLVSRAIPSFRRLLDKKAMIGDGDDIPFVLIRMEHLLEYFKLNYVSGGKGKKYLNEEVVKDFEVEPNKDGNIQFDFLRMFRYAMGRDVMNGVKVMGGNTNEELVFMYALAEFLEKNMYKEYAILTEG